MERMFKQWDNYKVVYTRGSHVRIQGSKWNQAINVHFWRWSRDQDELWATNINQSTHFLRRHGYVSVLLNSRKIKWSGIIFTDQDSWSRLQTLLQAIYKWLPHVVPGAYGHHRAPGITSDHRGHDCMTASPMTLINSLGSKFSSWDHFHSLELLSYPSFCSVGSLGSKLLPEVISAILSGWWP